MYRGLTRLQASEFLYETSVFPDLEYTFKHALTHEVAYASVLQDRRRALHARIVEAIETLYPDRSDEQVERLAHHAFRGELREKAVTYLRHAGAKAVTRSAYPEAVTRFEQALDGPASTARHAPEGRERDRSSSRASAGALPAERARDRLAISPRSRRAGPNAR